MVIRQLSAVEQVLTHGTPDAPEQFQQRPAPATEEVRAPDGVQLLAELARRGLLPIRRELAVTRLRVSARFLRSSARQRGYSPSVDPVRNPYAPGAGQRPPELAGRDEQLAGLRRRARAGGAGPPGALASC